MDKFDPKFPNYDDDSDYNTNANSYYKDLGRKTKLIKLLAKRIWEYENTLNETLEQIEQRLTDYITENDLLMNERLENWDKRIDEMPEEMKSLFIEWLNDGTLEQIINDDVLGNKADKSFVDDELGEVNSQLAQKGSLNRQKQGGSFVDKINELNTVKGISLIKQTNGFDIVVLLKNPEKSGFQYQFRKNPDGLVLLDSILAGDYVNNEIENKTVNLEGTYITTTEDVAYTVTPDDYFTFTFTGSGFDFNTITGYRSGVWEFDVEKIGKKTIDTYTTTQTDVSRMISVFKDLPYDTYKVKAIFKGKSPFSTETVETRGWVYNYLVNPIIVYSSYHPLENKITLSDQTINDYAITFRKTDLSTGMTWTPVHGGVTGVSVLRGIKIYVDGVMLTDADIAHIKSQYDIKKVELIQSFRGRNGNSDIDLTSQVIKHSINSDGVLSINNTVKFLEDCTIGNAYLNMLGANQNTFDKLYLNNKQTIALNGGFKESMAVSDDVSSASFVGTYDAGRYVGLGVDSLSFAEASGAHLKPDDLPVHLTFRDDGVAKFYIKAIETNGTVIKGDILSNVSRYVPTYGVQFPNIELLSIL